METRCHCKILHISYKDHVINKEVRSKIQQAIRPKKTQTAVVWTCLQFIRSGQNHLARHSERGKKTRQTEEEGEENIREWTGLEFAKSNGDQRHREAVVV